MDEKQEKKIRKKEEREAKKAIRKKFLAENADLIVQMAISIVSVLGSIIGVVGIFTDHRMTKSEETVHDSENDVYWHVHMSNSETEEMLDREKNGESRREALHNMGKI